MCEGSFVRSNDQVLISTKDEALICFFIQLHEMLRKIATVPPINMMSYAKSLDSKIAFDDFQD